MMAYRKSSKEAVVFLITFAFFLDHILLTVIVPIMPHFLYSLRVQNDPSNEDEGNSTYILDSDTKYSANRTNDTVEYRPTTSADDETDEKRHEELIHESFAIGIMFASKPFVHLAATPFVGILMSRISGDRILFGSFLVSFVSTIIFGVGNSYAVLFAARSLQGFGSALAGLSGSSIIAELYQDNNERGNAMAISLTGIALGTLIGPTYGGILYELVGKTIPFLILAIACLFAAGFQLYIHVPQVKKQKLEFSSLLAVVKDPYILLACGAIGFANIGTSFLEPTLPVWMMDSMNARQWQQGAVFLPESIAYLLCTCYVGTLGNQLGRWCTAMLGFILLGLGYLILPLSQTFLEMFLPMIIMGFSIALVDGAMVPELGNLADLRHSAVYGAVYALEEISVCFGNMIAPAISGVLMNSIGFEWSSIGIAVMCFMYAPFMYFLRNPSSSEENQMLLMMKENFT